MTPALTFLLMWPCMYYTSSADFYSRGDADESDADDPSSLECCSWSSRCPSPESVASNALISSPFHPPSLLGATSTLFDPPKESKSKKATTYIANSCSAALTSPLELLKMKVLVHTSGMWRRSFFTFGWPTKVRFECPRSNGVRPPLDTLGVFNITKEWTKAVDGWISVRQLSKCWC